MLSRNSSICLRYYLLAASGNRTGRNISVFLNFFIKKLCQELHGTSYLYVHNNRRKGRLQSVVFSCLAIQGNVTRLFGCRNFLLPALSQRLLQFCSCIFNNTLNYGPMGLRCSHPAPRGQYFVDIIYRPAVPDTVRENVNSILSRYYSARTA